MHSTSKNESKDTRVAIDALGIKMLSREDVEKLVARVMAENRQLVEKQCKGAFGTLMGLVMKEARGKANPAVVSAIVREKLK